MAMSPSTTSLFEQRLAATLNSRKEKGRYHPLYQPFEFTNTIDFGSNDTLSLSSSGALRRELLLEIERNPECQIGSKGSRILDGNNQYVVDLESYLAKFHGAETGLFFNSGYDANVAVFRTLPQPGDVIVHDEYIHASAIDGMRESRAAMKLSFRHNNVESFKEVLERVRSLFPDILEGGRSVFIAVEALYSMDGDSPPINQLLAAAKELLPLGDVIFYIDEAHSTGIVGPRGSGFVCHHGLEHEFALRVHTFGKAMSCTGAVVLCSSVVKDTLVNYARNFIYSTAPSFPALACVKAGYNFLESPEADQARQYLQKATSYFIGCFFEHRSWSRVQEHGIVGVPTSETLVLTKGFHSPIVPVLTKAGKAYNLRAWLLREGFSSWGLAFPIVPKGEDRLRVVIHADNSHTQIEQFVDCIIQWALDQEQSQEPLIALRGGEGIGKSCLVSRSLYAVQGT